MFTLGLSLVRQIQTEEVIQQGSGEEAEVRQWITQAETNDKLRQNGWPEQYSKSQA